VHGRDDTIIPVAHGRALAAAVPGAEFHELDCGHNDCPRPWPLVRAFLLDRGLMGAVRQHSAE
jgi:pimeloyl-ACP methyl ester carboxylesterase